MATMADFLANLNTGLGNLTTTPMGQLGIQMLANSGYRPDNAGFGQRMGGAFSGMIDMQNQQAQLGAQNQLRQVQAMQAMMEAQKLKREQDTQDQQRTYFQQNPNAIPNSPTANIMGGLGATNLAPYIKADQGNVPSRQAIYMRQNPDNTQTQMIYNMKTGGYDEGATTTPVAQQSLNATVQNNAANQQARADELKVKQQQADNAAAQAAASKQRADAMTATAQRESLNTLRTQNIAKGTLDVAYNGTRAQMDKQIETIDDLLKDEGLGRTFGWTGQAPTAPGSDAARVEAKLAKLRSGAGLAGLTQLSQMGIRLTPVSDNDMRVASESTMSLSNRMSEKDARATLENYKQRLIQTRDEAGRNYDTMAKAYELPQAQQPQQQQQQRVPVRNGVDSSGRKVVQYSDGSIEYAN